MGFDEAPQTHVSGTKRSEKAQFHHVPVTQPRGLHAARNERMTVVAEEVVHLRATKVVRSAFYRGVVLSKLGEWISIFVYLTCNWPVARWVAKGHAIDVD